MFKGSNVALITPFKNNSLDEEAYIKLIHFHIDNGTSGLVPAGTTGESPTLSHEEHQRVIDLCIKESNGKIPVIAGTGSNSTEEAISLTSHAEKVGAKSRMKAAERADGVLIKYRQLLSDTDRDRTTLKNLEQQYRSILLEKARMESPWELITKPVLLPNPVAPKKKTILAIGLFGGFLLGSTAALLNDNKKDLFLLKDDIESMSKM